MNCKAHLVMEDKQQKQTDYSFYFKFHSLNLFSREFNRYARSNFKETKIYSGVQEALNKFSAQNYEAPARVYLPRLYYSFMHDDDYVLVIENMKSKGYIVNDKKLGLSFSQLKLIIDQIATWHGLSYAYNQSNEGKEMQLPKTFELNSRVFVMFKYFLAEGLQNASYALKNKDEYKDIADMIKNIHPILQELENAAFFSPKNAEIQCLVHGDLWNSNILLKYSEDDQETPTDVCFIDWQMTNWGMPVADLHYLLYSSTTYEVRKNHLDNLLKLYYDKFIHLAGPIQGYTFERFYQQFQDTKIIGFCMGLMLSQGTLSEAGKNINQADSASTSVRGFKFNIKRAIAAKVVPLICHPYFNKLMKVFAKKMFSPIAKEIEEGTNQILNQRLLGIFQEAKETGFLKKIYQKHSGSN